MGKFPFGVLFVFFFFSFALNMNLLAATPKETIQSSVEAALDVLRDPAMQEDSAKKAKEKRLWAVANNLFDFSELSRRTLGKNWAKLSLIQQKEFTELFSTLLGNLYIERIMSYSNERVVFYKVKRREKKAVVYSNIVQETRKIPIDYRVILKNGEWKVYDVLVEGISLVKNYRSQFKDILKNKDPEHLLKTLREKVKEEG